MDDLKHLFPGSSGRVYLNTATMALGNRRAAHALGEAVDQWQNGTFDWMRAEASAEQLRGSIAALLGTVPTNIAFVTGASGGAGTVAAQLPRIDGGANVVVPSRDYSSNFLSWMLLRERGYELRLVDDVAGVLSSDHFAAAIDDQTSLIATSLVHSASGFRVDLEALKEIAATAGAWLVVDASQALGNLRINIDGVNALFSCSHKWLLGVRGMGHLYVAPELHNAFAPVTPGWKATIEPAAGFYGPDLTLSATASKLDVSSPWFDPIANLEGLRILEEIGIDAIEEHNNSLVEYLEAGGLEVPFEPHNRSPIVSIALPDPEKTLSALEAHGVTAAVRAGRLRVAVHLYNTQDDMDTVISVVK